MRFRPSLKSPFEWDPWREIEDLRRALHGMSERPGRSAPAPAVGSGFIPEVDLSDDGAAFVMCVDLPGVKEENLDIAVEGSTLTICGERHANGSKGGSCVYCERPAGRFARTIELPGNVDADRVKATLNHGVLEITLPKTKTAAPKKVVVALGGGE